VTEKRQTKVRCKGCGVLFSGLWGDVFALHMLLSQPCVEFYAMDTIDVGRHTVINGTLHLVNTGHSGKRKWQVRGVSPRGNDVLVQALSHKAKAERLLEEFAWPVKLG
jgi:hypothetical protein